MLSERSVKRFGSESCWSRRNSESATAFGLGRQRRAARRRDVDDAVPATRRPDDAPERGEEALLEEARGHAVRGDHQVLDDLATAALVDERERDDLAVLRDGAGFGRLELECAVLDATTTKPPRRLFLHEQLIAERGVLRDLGRRLAATIEPRAHVLVDELRVVAQARAVHLGRDDRPVRGDRHVRHDREAIDAGEQRGHVARQLVRQHRERRHAGVERRGVRRGMAVEGRLLRDEHVDVRDADPHADRAVGEALRDLDLIEVGRLAVVDRRPEQLALVAHVGGIARAAARKPASSAARGKSTTNPSCVATFFAIATRSMCGWSFIGVRVA